jgi:hypothetical protein
MWFFVAVTLHAQIQEHFWFAEELLVRSCTAEQVWFATYLSPAAAAHTHLDFIITGSRQQLAPRLAHT